MLSRIVIACIAGVVVFLVCLFIGMILGSLDLPVMSTIGKFLKEYAVIIGVIGGFLTFFGAWSPFGSRA